jgi:hypothetical protein
MKKKIIILIVLICFCCTGIFAEDFWGFGSRGASFFMDTVTIAIGLGLALVPVFDSDLAEPPYSTILYLTGGGFALIGLIGLIYDAVVDDSDYYAKAIKETPILKVVSVTSNGKSTFLGARFSF